MNKTAAFFRITAAVSLVATAALSLIWVILDPPFPGTAAERLEALDTAGVAALIAATAFAASQLFFLVAVLGVAQLIRDRVPTLSMIGLTLAVLGGFGHAVFAGTQFLHLAMAQDPANRVAYGTLLDGDLPVPFEIISLLGLLGTVLGILFLSIGLLVARVGARWVPYALFAFLIAEFIGNGFTEWASLAAGVLYLAAFTALAVAVWRSGPVVVDVGSRVAGRANQTA